jgi:ubiquinone/menaquinone biosynthesis C-methylase UbiE
MSWKIKRRRHPLHPEQKMVSTSQFAHPRGFFGHLAGVIMAIENRGRNRWAISHLALEPDDRVLEIGFGPGWSIAEMSKHVTRGKIVGVDASEAMVSQASQRNRAAILQGRVELHRASAGQLPLDTETFDKVLTINSLPFWDDGAQGLGEIRRVLRPNGKLVVVLQPVWVKKDTQVQQVAQELVDGLERAGFRDVHLEKLPAKPPILGALGEK